MGASEICKCWKETKAEKISKSFITNSFLLYDGAKNRPPETGFWNFAVIYVQTILAFSQKKSVGCKWNWKVLKGPKIKYMQNASVICILHILTATICKMQV